jgi:hemolysin III
MTMMTDDHAFAAVEENALAYEPATVFPPLHEEVVNTITHGLGLALALWGMHWVVGYASRHGDFWHVIGAGVYGATLVMVYAASTLYHAFQEYRTKSFFRLVDHVCIYLLIAGTYTPFTLIEGGFWGWSILTLVWVFALAGALFKIVFSDRLDSMSYLPYVAIGWLAVVAAKPIYDTLPMGVIGWILLGGLAYTLGVYFVVLSRPFYHSIWHLFVLAGSACHFLGVVDYLRFRAM